MDDDNADDIEAQLAKDHAKVQADDLKRGATAATTTEKRFRERPIHSPGSVD